jgi:hypothetical protein
MTAASPQEPVLAPSASDATPAPASALEGRIDAIEHHRVYGWAFDRARPGLRLAVTVRLDGRVVGEAMADRMRVDLRRNGIGDGAHAFEVALDNLTAAERDRLDVTAHAPGEDSALVLLPPGGEPSAAAIGGSVARLLEQFDMLVAAQRKSQIIQRETVEMLRDTTQRVETLSKSETDVAGALADCAARQADLARRIADLEVFHLRLDRTLATFDDRVATLTDAADRPMRRAMVLMTTLCGIAAFSGLVSVSILLLRKAGI